MHFLSIHSPPADSTPYSGDRGIGEGPYHHNASPYPADTMRYNQQADVTPGGTSQIHDRGPNIDHPVQHPGYDSEGMFKF